MNNKHDAMILHNEWHIDTTDFTKYPLTWLFSLYEWNIWKDVLSSKTDIIDVTLTLMYATYNIIEHIEVDPPSRKYTATYKRHIKSNYWEATCFRNWTIWQNAIKLELKQLTNINRWNLVELLPGAKAISNKWVFSLRAGAKRKDLHKSDTQYILQKAWLVTLGDHQVHKINYDETYALVIKLLSLRLLLTIAAILESRIWFKSRVGCLYIR